MKCGDTFKWSDINRIYVLRSGVFTSLSGFSDKMFYFRIRITS